MRAWSGFNWLRIGLFGFCESDNQPTGSIKEGGFFGQLSVCQLLKKDGSME